MALKFGWGGKPFATIGALMPLDTGLGPHRVATYATTTAVFGIESRGIATDLQNNRGGNLSQRLGGAARRLASLNERGVGGGGGGSSSGGGGGRVLVEVNGSPTALLRSQFGMGILDVSLEVGRLGERLAADVAMERPQARV